MEPTTRGNARESTADSDPERQTGQLERIQGRSPGADGTRARKQPPPCIIPAALDEAGLTATEFRVLAHLYRRAGAKGYSNTSAAGIAKTCDLSRRTVISVLAKLENRGAIARKHGRGLIPTQFIQPLSAWTKPYAKSAPVQNLHQCKSGPSTRANTVPQPVQDLHPKEIIERNSLEGNAGTMSAGEYPSAFIAFWEAYPKRVGKAAALKAWSKIDNRNDDAILAAIAWQVQQPDWLKEAGRFIPHPATWLYGRRWEDEQTIKREQNGLIRAW